jgi:hypothetical protein
MIIVRITLLLVIGKQRSEDSESVVIFQTEIVYLRPAQQLQQEIPEKPEDGIKKVRQRPGFEHPIIETIEDSRAATDKRQGMNGVRTVIKPIAHFQHHALIDIQSLRGYFVHDRTRFPCIHELELTDRFPNANDLTVIVTRRALLIVNEQDFFSSHESIN